MKETSRSVAGKAWSAVGWLLLVGVGMLVVRELPSLRRELRIMRM